MKAGLGVTPECKLICYLLKLLENIKKVRTILVTSTICH